MSKRMSKTLESTGRIASDYRNSGRFRGRRLRTAGIVALVAVVCLLGAIAAISHTYQLPFRDTARLFAKQGALTAIHAALLIHDPTVSRTVNPTLGNALDSEMFRGYGRIEDSLGGKTLPPGAELAEIRNERIRRSRFSFGYQPFEEPRLAQLRAQYRLDDVVAGAGSEFEAMVLLRNWARSRFRRMDYQPLMRDFDALEILQSNHRNISGAPHNQTQYRPCHFFPMFYAQVLLSMGHNVRLVQIANHRGLSGHGMTEVCSNQYRKWITMDADLNLHYEKDGVPLNMLEVHNERYEQGPSKVSIVHGVHSAEDYDPNKVIDLGEMIDYHSYIQVIDLRNDWMTNHYFPGHPRRSDWASLQWADPKLPPVFSLKEKTSNVDDFYWTLNQTEILVKPDPSQDGKLQLGFRTFTPNFREFEISVDDVPVAPEQDAFFAWELHPGRNRIEVRSANKFGVRGIPSHVEIRVPEAA